MMSTTVKCHPQPRKPLPQVCSSIITSKSSLLLDVALTVVSGTPLVFVRYWGAFGKIEGTAPCFRYRWQSCLSSDFLVCLLVSLLTLKTLLFLKYTEQSFEYLVATKSSLRIAWTHLSHKSLSWIGKTALDPLIALIHIISCGFLGLISASTTICCTVDRVYMQKYSADKINTRRTNDLYTKVKFKLNVKLFKSLSAVQKFISRQEIK